MTFKRIKAFGCSNTYGQGLPDCFIKPSHPGPLPSDYAWPALVAHNLELECINYGICGGSPKETLYVLTHSEITVDDLVLILWPQHFRTCFIKDAPSKDPEYRPSLGEYEVAMHRIGPWSKDKFYKLFHYENDAVFSFSMIAKFAQMFLDEKGVKNIHRLYYRTPPFPAWNNVDFGEVPFDDYTQQYPKSLDNQHPGPLAHEHMAQDFLAQVKRNGW